MKAKLEFSKCMGIMLAHLCHPYILSTTVPSDTTCEFLIVNFSLSLCPIPSSVTVSSPGGTVVGQSTSDTQSSPVPQSQSQSNSLSSGHTLGTVISDTVEPAVMTMEHSRTIHFISESVGPPLQRHISFHNCDF